MSDKVRIVLRFTRSTNYEISNEVEEETELVVARNAIADRAAFDLLAEIVRERLLDGDTARERVAIGGGTIDDDHA